MTGTPKVTVDTSEAKRDLDQLEQAAALTAQTTMSTIKKSYQSLVLLADLFGQVIPMWFNILATAAIMAGEMFAELAAAETVTGWLAFKAGVTWTMSLMMFYRAMTLRQTGEEMEDKLATTLMIGNLWF